MNPAYLALLSKPHEYLNANSILLKLITALYHRHTNSAAKKVLKPLHMNPSKKAPNTPPINICHRISTLSRREPTPIGAIDHSRPYLYIMRSPSPQPILGVYLSPKSPEFVKSAAVPQFPPHLSLPSRHRPLHQFVALPTILHRDADHHREVDQKR